MVAIVLENATTELE